MKSLKYILSGLFAMMIAQGAFAQQVVSTANPELHYYILTAIAVLLLVVIVALNGSIKNIATGKSLWEKMNAKGTGIIAFLITLGFSTRAVAQSAEDMVVVEPNYGLLFWLFVMVDLVLLIIVLVQLSVLSGLVNTIKGNAAESEEYQEVETGFDRFWKSLTNATPVEREAEVMTDHEYDGIKELDNVLPPWWLWLFYVTIVFAVIYIGYYEFYKSTDMSVDEYQAEVAMAEELQKNIAVTAETVAIMEDASNLANGKKIFESNCASCHLNDGGGSIGPNLTDQYWKNGGSIHDLFTTVTEGISGTAMVSWQALLSPNDIQDVTSYILVELQGSTPANPKDPEGELYQPE